MCINYYINVEPTEKTALDAQPYTFVQGCAVILPAYPKAQQLSKLDLSPDDNEGKPIRYLISAPTMRVPTNVSQTANAYLAFRAVLRAGKSGFLVLHNIDNKSFQ